MPLGVWATDYTSALVGVYQDLEFPAIAARETRRITDCTMDSSDWTDGEGDLIPPLGDFQEVLGIN
jgi:hypothetical protein